MADGTYSPSEDGYPTDEGLWFECPRCGGEGWEDRHDEDPLWYGHELYRCDDCNGKGGWLAPWAEVEAERFAR